MKNIVFALMLAASATATAEDINRAHQQLSFQTTDLDVRAVSGTEKILVTSYHYDAKAQQISVATRTVDGSDASGSRDYMAGAQKFAAVESQTGATSNLNPVGCTTGCVLIDTYQHTTSLGNCNNAVVTTYVYMDETGQIFTQNQVAYVRVPSCKPNN